MIEAKQTFFILPSCCRCFFIIEYTDCLNNNIIISKQISRENADFPRSLVQLRIGLSCAIPIDRIEGLVRLNPLAQSE